MTFDPAVLEAALAERRATVDRTLPALLPEAPPPVARVRAAMSYSLMAGGKRLRPLLVVLTCEAAGGDHQRVAAAYHIGCAWEYVHTYSLIHDDLPAMDDDDLRRGKPTCHKQFDEATAVLAGDALLTHAFVIVAEHAPTAGIARWVVARLASSAGVPGMIGGQAADMAGENQAPSIGLTSFIHLHKTTALIRSAVETGARMADSNKDTLAAVGRYGECVGLAFQIADDILDCTESAEQLGKTPGKDVAAGKQTYVAAMGLERAREEAQRLADEAIDALASAQLPNAAGVALLADLARYIVHRRN